MGTPGDKDEDGDPEGRESKHRPSQKAAARRNAIPLRAPENMSLVVVSVSQGTDD